MAFGKLKEYSYADQKTRVHRRLRLALWCALLAVAYLVLSRCLFSMRVMESESMRPGIASGDRLVFAAFGVNHLAAKVLPLGALPLRRGAVVLVDLAAAEERPFLSRAGDGILRFFTAGRAGLFDENDRLFVKRVLALPGDEVSLVNYVLRVKPAGEPYTYTEYEVVKAPYDLILPEANALHGKNLPFSGDAAPRILGEDEYFLLSDDRGNTNDSRTWGPVPAGAISGKALFRYWPLGRLGLPDRSRGK